MIIKLFLVLLTVGCGLLSLTTFVDAAGNGPFPYKPVQKEWAFDGVFGKFDRNAIQRGFQVYRESCGGCHCIKRIAFRNLTEIGFPEAEAKAIAAEYEIEDGPNDDGEMFFRKGILSDYFPNPFANNQAAKAANNGALPPDLSLIIKARPDGANYVYSLLTGYDQKPISGIELQDGLHYNPWFPTGQLAMAPPLMEGTVDYMEEEVKETVEQMSHDIVNFLQWAAEPEMEHRKAVGMKSIIFLIAFTLMFIVAKKRVWARLYR